MGGEEMIKFKWTTVFLLGFAVLLGTSPALAEKMTVGWSAVSALNAPFWVMNDAGFLKKEGLDANLIYIPSSSTMAQAQLSGNVDVSTANSQMIVDAGLTGGDLVAIGAVTNAVAFYVMANPKISSVADLKGQKVGVTRFGASTDFAVRKLLEKYNLRPVNGCSDRTDWRDAGDRGGSLKGSHCGGAYVLPHGLCCAAERHANPRQHGERGYRIRSRRHNNVAQFFAAAPGRSQSLFACLRQSGALHAHQQGRV